MTGKLIGIARRAGRRAPLEELATGEITVEAGLVGDRRRASFGARQITILAREDWAAVLGDLAGRSSAAQGQPGTGPPDLPWPDLPWPDLPWTVRRANLFVEGIRLPRAKGGVLRIGLVVLEITGQTSPCYRMEEAHKGLLSALHPDWRGGVTCLVREGGRVTTGDPVEVLFAPPDQRAIQLPE